MVRTVNRWTSRQAPPQGSPISPVLFAIYIAEIHEAVERQVEDSRGISFVDDMTWLVEGAELNDVVKRLERCMAASLQWANNNAVRLRLQRLRRSSSPRGGSTTVTAVTGPSGWEASLSVSHPQQRGGLESCWTPLSLWREPKATDCKDPPGRGKAVPDCQQIRCTTCSSTQPSDIDRPGYNALCNRADLEGTEWGRGRVPAGHQPYGTINTRCMELDTTGHPRGAERPNASQSAAESPSGQAYPAPPHSPSQEGGGPTERLVTPPNR